MVIKSEFPDLVIPTSGFYDYLMNNICKFSEDKIAIISVYDDISYTFQEVIQAVEHCRKFLLQKGFQKNDVVALCCPNCPEFIFFLVATSSFGGIVTTCNPLCTSYELMHQFNDSKPRCVFTVSEHAQKCKDIQKQCPWLKDVFVLEENDCFSFKKLPILPTASTYQSSGNIDPCKDILLLPYSSGTTGYPKGVMLSHQNMVSAVALTRNSWKMFYHDVEYLVLPMFHIYGMMRTLSTLYQGACVVLDQRSSLTKWARTIEKYKVTLFPLVPPMLVSLSKSNVEKEYDMSSLRLILVGAAPIAPEVLKNVSKKLNCVIMQGWGLTETAGISVILNYTSWGMSVTSTGVVSSMNFIKICDIETEKELGPNEIGEILVKGPEVMIGYYKKPDATARIFSADGFLHTGDVGYFDERHQLYVVDRVKELIKYKGFQVAPAELEHVLMSHSKIADAAVIGVDNQSAGELPKAFIVKKLNSLCAEEIDAYMKEKLSSYKQLRGGIEFVDQIPKSPSGKILRRVLRQKNSKISKL